MNKKSKRKTRDAIRKRLFLIEDRGKDDTKWFVSFFGPNPIDRGCVELPGEREALKLIQLITELVP